MTAGNGRVDIRSRLFVQIRITDPDGVLNYWVFCGPGVRGPLIAAAFALDCPNPVVIFLRRGAHNVHPHTVVYDDCQDPVGATERWVVPATDLDKWRNGERIGTIPAAPEKPTKRRRSTADAHEAKARSRARTKRRTSD
jgi:hypothetical protein